MTTPPPTGQFQTMLVPGPWISTQTGQPSPAFFELLRTLWNRTGGSTTIIGPDGTIGLAALKAAIAQAQADATEAIALGEFGVAGGDDTVIPDLLALTAATALALNLALGADEAPPQGPDQGALLGFMLS